MSAVTATEARAKLYGLIDETNTSHEPVTITGKRGNAVLVGEEDWEAIQETLYLKSVPGLDDAIKKDIQTPVEECADKLDWRT